MVHRVVGAVKVFTDVSVEVVQLLPGTACVMDPVDYRVVN